MKRKIAFLLAVLMILAIVPAQTAFATQAVLYRPPVVVNTAKGSSYAIETRTLLSAGLGGTRYDGLEKGPYSWPSGSDPKYVRTAPELVIEIQYVETGDRFQIKLNGTGDFGFAPTKSWNAVTSGTTVSNKFYGNFFNDELGYWKPNTNVVADSHYGMYVRKGTNDVAYNPAQIAKRTGDAVNTLTAPQWVLGPALGTTDGTGLNTIISNLAGIAGSTPLPNDGKDEMPYAMEIVDAKTAWVTVLDTNPFDTATITCLKIPLPLWLAENATVTASLGQPDGYFPPTPYNFLSSPVFTLAVAPPSGAVTITSNTTTSYELFPINTLTVKENIPGIVATSGTFSIQTRQGFSFVSPLAYADGLKNFDIPNDAQRAAAFHWYTLTEATLLNGGTAPSASTYYQVDSLQSSANLDNERYGYWKVNELFGFLVDWAKTYVNNSRFISNPSKEWNYPASAPNLGQIQFSGVGFGNAVGSTVNVTRIFFKEMRNGEIDFSTVYISYEGVAPSKNVAGVLRFINLPLLVQAAENAQPGDVLVDINGDNPAGANPSSGNCKITSKDVKIGTRKNWGIDFKVSGSVPTLISGKYEGAADTGAHKVAVMTFAERLPNSWNANRQTVFEFPDWVKVSKIKLTEVKNLRPGLDKAEVTPSTPVISSASSAYVKIEDNKVIFSGIALNATDNGDNPASFTLEAWVSIEPNLGEITKEGYAIPSKDISVKLDGTAILDVVDAKNLIVGKAIKPVTITPKAITSLKVGYQTQIAQEFTVQEAQAGILQKGDTLKLSLTDDVNVSDMSFVSAKYEVVDDGGDLKLKNFKYAGFGNSTASSPFLTENQGGTISVDIAAASSKASTIRFYDIQVKVDRAIPESNFLDGYQLGYNLIAWGNSVANNFDARTNPKVASFTTPGIKTPYIVIGTLGSKGAMNNQVRLPINGSYIEINGVQYPYPDSTTKPFIQDVTEATMIPIRYAALALMDDPTSLPKNADGSIDWDNPNLPLSYDITTKTVTFFTTGLNGSSKVIQFTANSDQMMVDGASMTMISINGKDQPVKAEIRDERMYVPFRSLGKALGIGELVNFLKDDNTKATSAEDGAATFNIPEKQ